MIEIDVYEGKLNLAEQRLCLEFANTANWHASQQPVEELNSYADLVAWARRVGLLSEAEAQIQLEEAARHSADAAVILDRAIELREAIFHIFSAVAGDRPPETADISLLNQWLRHDQERLRVVATDSGFTWQWGDQGTSLGQILGPVVQSAAELLVSADLPRVKECADDRGCGWLFVDTSRNQSRRWCSMESCGNRAKVRRHRRKQAENG
jgi:predicted RNA-binding Zn ribbon-like protein